MSSRKKRKSKKSNNRNQKRPNQIKAITQFKGKIPTVSLSVILKNESKVIERMLNSVYPILDYYIVVDTGSTDNTKEVVKKFFDEKGIPGEIIDHKWVDYQTARNVAREAVKGKADFGFWIDADEQLMLEENFDPQIFKRNLASYDGGNVKVSYGGQNYFRMQLFKADLDWRWYGPVHEVLVSDTPKNICVCGGLYTLVTADGNSWTVESIQEKYEGHAKILKEYVENDPIKDPRWLFYLAQSYRDAGTPENKAKAIKYYQERVKAGGGYWEEIYFSMLMVASLKAQMIAHPEKTKLGLSDYKVHEVIEDYLKCGKYNKYRVEHLMPVIQHYKNNNEYEIAYLYSSHAVKYAGKSPFPKSSLFINNDCYNWKIFDEHALTSWYSGRQDESKTTFKKLVRAMKKGVVPESEHKRIKENGKFYNIKVE